MASVDVFKGTGFAMSELTDSAVRAPYQPGRIGSMGLFEKKGIRTTTFQLERQGRSISLLPSKPRGSRGTQMPPTKRTLRTFNVPHIPHDAELLADSIQNIRAAASETELQAVSSVVNDVIDQLRQNHEVTHEFYRIGAIKGVLLDGDGTTTLIDLFSEFGISQTSVDFVLGTAGTDVAGKVEEVHAAMDDALGAQAYNGIHAFCGATFFSKLTGHAVVKDAYQRWNDGQYLRDTQRVTGFEYQGVFWERYRGKVGDVQYVPLADCRFVPLGVRGMFLERYAPADMMEFVNTEGQPIYVAQEPKPFNKGVDFHSQSNPIMMATIPEALIRGTTSN